MISPVKYLHPYKAGDMLCLLPGIKHIYETTGAKGVVYQRLGMPAYFDNTEDQCMSLSMFNALKPLIENQDYIESYLAWDGEKVDMDMTSSRMSNLVPIPNGSIHHWAWAIAPEMQCSLFVPWIESDQSLDPIFHDKVIINRTDRYLNPYISYHFLKSYQDKLMFAGKEEERDRFCTDFNLDIPWLAPTNYFELAKILKSCKLFLGSQSSCWHVADGMKSLRLLEASTTHPNTYPTGMNGYFFYHQKALEMQFEKLIS